jgi:hypothetical protein
MYQIESHDPINISIPKEWAALYCAKKLGKESLSIKTLSNWLKQFNPNLEKHYRITFSVFRRLTAIATVKRRNMVGMRTNVSVSPIDVLTEENSIEDAALFDDFLNMLGEIDYDFKLADMPKLCYMKFGKAPHINTFYKWQQKFEVLPKSQTGVYDVDAVKMFLRFVAVRYDLTY